MSNYVIYSKLKKMQQAYETAKTICLTYGALPSTFEETDKKINEIVEDAKSKIVGGVINKEIPK